MLPWGVGSGTRAPVISPFTNFAASLTPLYPSAVQAALPTPLAQLMHAAASERRCAARESTGDSVALILLLSARPRASRPLTCHSDRLPDGAIPCVPSRARREANDDSTLLKPKRSVTFSREQSAGGAELSSALGELGELASGSFTLRQHEQQQPQPFLADRLRADGFDRRLSGVHDGGQAAGGQATHTPFAEPSLADWARVGDPPDSIARVLSMQPTQRGLSPLSAELGGDADGAKNKQAVHKRRLQFECDQVAMEQLHGGSAALASTPLRTPVRETDEPVSAASSRRMGGGGGVCALHLWLCSGCARAVLVVPWARRASGRASLPGSSSVHVSPSSARAVAADERLDPGHSDRLLLAVAANARHAKLAQGGLPCARKPASRPRCCRRSLPLGFASRTRQRSASRLEPRRCAAPWPH